MASDWKAGRIIDDAKFTGLDMTVTDIQNFLNNKVPDCDTWGTQPASEYGRGDITHTHNMQPVVVGQVHLMFVLKATMEI